MLWRLTPLSRTLNRHHYKYGNYFDKPAYRKVAYHPNKSAMFVLRNKQKTFEVENKYISVIIKSQNSMNVLQHCIKLECTSWLETKVIYYDLSIAIILVMLQVVSNYVDCMIYSHDSINLRQYNTVIHCIISMSLLFILLRKQNLNNKNKKNRTHNKYELKRTIKKNQTYINYHYLPLFLVVYNQSNCRFC